MCAMGKRIDIAGQKFNKLTVVRFAGTDNSGLGMWWCSCDCGKMTKVRSMSLRAGQKSCGCIKGSKYGDKQLMHEMFVVYKRSARIRTLAFGLTFEQFERLTQRYCFYCGSPPSNVRKSRTMNPDFIYSGIDRVDNTQGYTMRNCVPCCAQCNRAKESMHLGDFVTWVNKLGSTFLRKAA